MATRAYGDVVYEGAHTFNGALASPGAGNQTTKVGALANAGGTNATAYGYNASAGGLRSVALGRFSSASSSDTVAVGNSASATAASNTAVGSGALANVGGGATAVGAQAEATGTNSTAIGQICEADSESAVALGRAADALAVNALAIGHTVVASATQSIAVGFFADASGDRSVALGPNTTATQTGAIAFGDGAQSTGTGGSVAIGDGAIANTAESISIGPSAQQTHVSAIGSVCIGRLANSKADRGICIGYNSFANTGGGAIAIGYGASSANGGLCIGYFSSANNNQAVAIGYDADLSGSGVVIGSNINVTGGNVVAIGPSVAPTNDSVAIGVSASTTGSNSVALGNNVTAAIASIGIGYGITATGNNSIVIGFNARSDNNVAMAFGQGAKVTGTAATGRLVAVPASQLVVGADTDTFTIDDGVNPAVTFIFDDDGSVVEDAVTRAVNHTGVEDATAMRTAIRIAINLAPALDINATNGAGVDDLDLTNLVIGVVGNTTSSETVADAGFSVTDMINGEDTGTQTNSVAFGINATANRANQLMFGRALNVLNPYIHGYYAMAELETPPSGADPGWAKLYTKKSDGGLYFLDSAGTETDLLTDLTGTPGGADTQIQFNDSNTFGGEAGFTFNKTSGGMSTPGSLFSTKSQNGTTAHAISNQSTSTGAAAATYARTDTAYFEFTAYGSNFNQSLAGEAMAGAVRMTDGAGATNAASKMVIGTVDPTLSGPVHLAARNVVGLTLKTDRDVDLAQGVKVGSAVTAEAGRIEWDGSNFRGHTGSAWVNLDTQGQSPGGADTQLQYNNGGSSFGGMANVTFDGTDLTVANGTNLITRGSGTDSIELGTAANASALHAVSLGDQSEATGDDSVAVGYQAVASSNGAIAIGSGTTAAVGVEDVVIGPASSTNASAAVASAGTINVPAGSAFTLGVDNQTVRLNDLVGSGLVNYTFDDDNSVTETQFLRRVPFTALDTADQVRDSLIAAINNVGHTMGITASIGGPGQVSLLHDTPGEYNSLITPQNPPVGLTTSGMSGGRTVGNPTRCVVVGRSLEAQANNGTLIGQSSTINAASSFSICIGDTNTVGYNADSAIAIGEGVTVNDRRSVAIGSGVSNDGDTCVAIGRLANVSEGEEGTVVIGPDAYSAGTDTNVVIGKGSGLDAGNFGVVIGGYAWSGSGFNTVSIGAGATVDDGANAAVAIGSGPGASAASSVAIGDGASVDTGATGGIALGGARVRSSAVYSIAIGENADIHSGGQRCTAIGRQAFTTTGNEAMALGYDSRAEGYHALSVGSGVAWADAEAAINVGNWGGASSKGAISIGGSDGSTREVSAYALGGIGIGFHSQVSGSATYHSDYSIAIGEDAIVLQRASSSIAIGHNARVNINNSTTSTTSNVCIGADSGIYRGDENVVVGYGTVLPDSDCNWNVVIGPSITLAGDMDECTIVGEYNDVAGQAGWLSVFGGYNFLGTDSYDQTICGYNNEVANNVYTCTILGTYNQVRPNDSAHVVLVGPEHTIGENPGAFSVPITNSMLIGYSNTTLFDNSVVLGVSQDASAPNRFQVGGDNARYMDIRGYGDVIVGGTTNPGYYLINDRTDYVTAFTATATTGGSLPASYGYIYRVSAVFPWGESIISSLARSAGTSAINNRIAISITPVSGATSYNLYVRSTTAASVYYNKWHKLDAGIPGTTYNHDVDSLTGWTSQGTFNPVTWPSRQDASLYPTRITGNADASWMGAGEAGWQLGLGTSTPNERLTIDGAVSLAHMTTPPSGAQAGFGRIYVKDSDGSLYFLDEAGTETEIIPTPTPPAGVNTQVQYNASGLFGASSNLVYDGALSAYGAGGNDTLVLGGFAGNGSDAKTASSGAVAIGASANIDGNSISSIAVGLNSDVDYANFSILIGPQSDIRGSATYPNSSVIAMGRSSYVGQRASGSVVIGDLARINITGTTFNCQNNVIVGAGANYGRGQENVVLGNSITTPSTASCDWNVLIGSNITVSGAGTNFSESVVIGEYSTIAMENSWLTAVGGFQDIAEQNWDSVYLGYNVTTGANSYNNVGIGDGVSVAAATVDGVVIGTSGALNASQGVALGNNTTVVATHTKGVAIGNDAVTTAASRCTIGTIGGASDLELQVGSGFAAWGATPPASQPAKINDPTGGTTIDSEARTAIQAIIDVLEGAGLAASV